MAIFIKFRFQTLNMEELDCTSVKMVLCSKVWQYRLWSFQAMDRKLERVLAKNQLYSNEIIDF